MTKKTNPEPVAYFAKREYGGVDLWEQVHAKYAHMSDVVPLYAHPDERIALLEGLLRNALPFIASHYDDEKELRERIRVALEEK